MRYKITYGPVRKKMKDRFVRWQCLIAVCLLLFMLAMKIFDPEVTAILQQYLLPAGEVPAGIVDFWEVRFS